MKKDFLVLIDGQPFEDSEVQATTTLKEAIKNIRQKLETPRKKVFQVVLDGEMLTIENSGRLFPLELHHFKEISLSTVDPYPIALDSISYLLEQVSKLETQLQSFVTDLFQHSTHSDPTLLQDFGKTMITIHNELEDIRSLIGWDFGLMVFHLEPLLDHCQRWQESAEILLLSDENDVSQYVEFLKESVLPQISVWKDIFSYLEQFVLDTLYSS